MHGWMKMTYTYASSGAHSHDQAAPSRLVWTYHFRWGQVCSTSLEVSPSCKLVDVRL